MIVEALRRLTKAQEEISDVQAALTPDRSETLAFNATLFKEPAERYRQELLKLGFNRRLVDSLNEGDKLKVSYVVNAHYFGEVADRLRAFTTIVSDPDVLADVSVNELEHGRSVLFDLVEEIVRVQEILRRRAKPARRGLWARLRDWWSCRFRETFAPSSGTGT